MHVVVMLEGCWQLAHDSERIPPIHGGHVVTLEGFHEALGHAIGLRSEP